MLTSHRELLHDWRVSTMDFQRNSPQAPSNIKHGYQLEIKTWLLPIWQVTRYHLLRTDVMWVWMINYIETTWVASYGYPKFVSDNSSSFTQVFMHNCNLKVPESITSRESIKRNCRFICRHFTSLLFTWRCLKYVVTWKCVFFNSKKKVTYWEKITN